MIGVCEHPLSDLVIAGESVNPLPTVFHTLLQTIADLMLLPPPGMFFYIIYNIVLYIILFCTFYTDKNSKL